MDETCVDNEAINQSSCRLCMFYWVNYIVNENFLLWIVLAGRGDIDDALGNFSLTLVDTLDTLVLLDETKEFERVVKLVIASVRFDQVNVVSVFENNIQLAGMPVGGPCSHQRTAKTSRGDDVVSSYCKIDWLTGYIVMSIHRLIDWLIGWLVGWQSAASTDFSCNSCHRFIPFSFIPKSNCIFFESWIGPILSFLNFGYRVDGCFPWWQVQGRTFGYGAGSRQCAAQSFWFCNWNAISQDQFKVRNGGTGAAETHLCRMCRDNVVR